MERQFIALRQQQRHCFTSERSQHASTQKVSSQVVQGALRCICFPLNNLTPFNQSEILKIFDSK